MNQQGKGTGRGRSPRGGSKKVIKLTPRQRELERKLKKAGWKPSFEEAMKWFYRR